MPEKRRGSPFQGSLASRRSPEKSARPRGLGGLAARSASQRLPQQAVGVGVAVEPAEQDLRGFPLSAEEIQDSEVEAAVQVVRAPADVDVSATAPRTPLNPAVDVPRIPP